MKNLILFLFLFSYSGLLSGQKIPLSPANIINLSAKGDANRLVDEQTLAGDPKAGSGGQPVTGFSYGASTTLYYPLEVVIDLFAVHNLTDIYFYDINAIDSLQISTGSPTAWVKAVAVQTDKYMTWRGFQINVPTRYIKLKFKGASSLISEVVLYGSRTGSIDVPVLPPPVSMPRPVVDDFVGINSFHDVPASLHKVAKHIREYHNWAWDEGNSSTSYTGYPANQYGWNPSWVSGSNWGWNFDNFYNNARTAGNIISPALQGAAPYLVNYDNTRSENKPIGANENSESPSSYVEHADYLYQFAARYGSTAVSNNKLKLRTDNASRTGLNYIRYIENWNEPDKNWEGKQSYFSPSELSAMLSADYDGHLGTLGNTVGVKNADPHMNLVMGGLVNADTMYLKSMYFWAKHFRNGSLPFDVLNFHHYSNDGGGQGTPITRSYTPEEDHLKDKVAAVVAFRNKYFPGIPVWYSEFGYDCNVASVQGVPVISGQTTWETQGSWIIRSYLAIMAGGADRAHMYMLRDVNGSSNTKFSSSGLTTAPTNDGTNAPYTKKNSWYYLYTFRKRLSGYSFKNEIPSGNPNVLIYAFENSGYPDSLAYVIWSPTRQNLTVNNYQLQATGMQSARKVELANNDTTGIETYLAISNGYINLQVDEKPDIIFLDKTSITTSFMSAEKAQLTVNTYPNPFNDEISFDLVNETITSNTITLMDLKGKEIITEAFTGLTIKLSTAQLQDGVYFVRISSNDKTKLIKVLKHNE